MSIHRLFACNFRSWICHTSACHPAKMLPRPQKHPKVLATQTAATVKPQRPTTPMVKLRLEQNLRKCRKEQAPQGRAPSFFLQQKTSPLLRRKKTEAILSKKAWEREKSFLAFFVPSPIMWNITAIIFQIPRDVWQSNKPSIFRNTRGKTEKEKQKKL